MFFYHNPPPPKKKTCGTVLASHFATEKFFGSKSCHIEPFQIRKVDPPPDPPYKTTVLGNFFWEF